MISEVFSNFNDSVIPRFSANRPPIKSLIQWLQQGLSPLFSTPGSLPAALQSANAIVTCTVQGGPWSLRGDTAGGKGRGAGAHVMSSACWHWWHWPWWLLNLLQVGTAVPSSFSKHETQCLGSRASHILGGGGL